MTLDESPDLGPGPGPRGARRRTHPRRDMAVAEIGRRLEDLVREVRDLTRRMLLREVYDAHREALLTRVSALEERAKEEESERAISRRLVYGLVGTFVLTTVANLLTTLLIR